MAARNHVVIEHGTIERIPLPESLVELRERNPRTQAATHRKRLLRLVPMRSKREKR